MSARSDAGGMEKVFQHCEITWKIENYFLATFGKNWIINSPEICVEEPFTRWKMSLTSDPEDRKSIFIQLERLERDPGPNSVWVDWRMTLIAKKGEDEVKYLTLTDKTSFGNHEYQKESFSRDTIEKRIVPPFDDKDTFCIRFQLIVSKENVDETYAKFNSDYDMTNLKVFIERHADKNAYDIEIKNKSKKIKAHKEILSSHSRYFENHIKRGTTHIKLDLDRVELTKIIAFCYSRDFKYVLSKPTLVLYDIIKKLKIKELDLYYSPSLITLNTALDVQYDEFRWVIENVSSRTNGTVIESPIICDGSFKTCWKLKLRIKVTKKSMRMSIFAESLKPEIEDTTNTDYEEADTDDEEAESHGIPTLVEFFPRNSDGSYFPKRSRVVGFTQANMTFNSDDFFEIEKSKIKSWLPDNKLHIIFRIQILLSKRVSERKSRKMFYSN